MPQDAFTLQFVAKELKSKFLGGKISKINQQGKDALTLLIYTKCGTVKLDIDLSAKYCRISAGEDDPLLPNPKNAPNFCMLLRKHLQNAEVTDIFQCGFERVICFNFKCFSEFEVCEIKLYAEIMGKYSNAILVKDGVILGALKTASLETGARRITLSGAKYVPPEKQQKCNPRSLDEIRQTFENYGGGDLAEFIANNVAGIAYSTACDIAEKFGVKVTAEQLFYFINQTDCRPCVVYKGGAPCDFKAYAAIDGKPAESILSAQAEFYGYAVREKAFADKKRKLLSAVNGAVKKCEKRLAIDMQKLEECKRADGIKLCGELITANIYAVERGAKEFKAVNYYDENCPQITIALDPRLTPAQNAQAYYKRYAKLKRTAETVQKQREQAEAQLLYLKSILGNLETAENSVDLVETEQELITLSLLPAPKQTGKKKCKGEESKTPPRTYLFGGFTVICGRNNIQNDNLTKGLQATDLWLHTKSFHSCHAAVLTGGKAPTEQVIKFAAEVCAYYSEARQNDKVAVDYTYKKYVKKPGGARCGFVVYTDFNTILVTPNAHAEERHDEQKG